MAINYKILGQQCPGTANSETTLYTVPAATQCVTSTIVVANRTNFDATFNINIRPAGAAVAAQHSLAFNATCQANTTIPMTLGVTLGATDVVSVQSGTASALTFQLYGGELTA